eukprot:CAMPEP_0114552664 /NCGR_PEP_ID=MMETSP0114-20121206/7243_1 /TAXON_ID=31324 /ORGANISM="Goniomonas sp, Strain m" /LENGTH=32 /DNA_ID= /DNA_START= /DNA_END= /DNA_ORIENTATION=
MGGVSQQVGSRRGKTKTEQQRVATVLLTQVEV